MLAGKRALVTGASSGIGLATVRVFINEGATVCATGRNNAALQELAQETGCSYVVGDITESGGSEAVVERAVHQLGGELSTLVNCAGVLHGGTFGTPACNLENFKLNFGCNTQALFEMMEHSIPHLQKLGVGASIVNVTSVNAKQSFGSVGNYCASKAAADMLTKCAAVDLATDGIRVNSVNPGLVPTELQLRGGMTDEAYAGLVQRSIEVTHPLAQKLGRVALPGEVGDLIAFLASDKAGFITGECVAIDGGRQCVGAR
eukprot:TRINITY_DN17594_c0_g1_i4.p1 TRINITY_DN17594_c0_g1~~TRINITY_DN17594_c0_g1_i4.p1  ORF type:complete len:260 (-),score=44.34 TRINITY_DN17594_c0_g1_i4:358-1137(-)